MTRDGAKEQLKQYLTDYVESITSKSKGKNMYVCPLCGSGTGNHKTGAFSIKDGTSWKCFSCNKGGDIFDLIGEVEGITGYNEKLNRAGEIFGVIIEGGGTARNNNTAVSEHQKEDSLAYQKTEQKERTDYTEYYKQCKEHIDDPAAAKYLSVRGISKATAERFNLGYDDSKKRLIIPTSRFFYTARSTDSAATVKYLNPKGAKADIFNISSLYSVETKPIFIEEGAINAMSVVEAGGEAIALNSAQYAEMLIEKLREIKVNKTLIISLDNDKAGANATQTLVNGFEELEISYIVENINGKYNDANDALIKDKKAFIEAVKRAENKAKAPDNTTDYIEYLMAGELLAFKEGAERKTGYSNLDAQTGGLYTGLYVIGGVSSVGKTTFIHQMADQMAQQGQHILYFSMEQSRLELVSKSIARTAAIKYNKRMQTSLEIRKEQLTEETLKAAQEYAISVGRRMNIIEGNFKCTVSFIGEYLKKYIARNSAKPVVIVDYLQILQPDIDPITNRKLTDAKAIADYNVTAFKRLSRDVNVPIIVVSSLNRSSYQTAIDFESFKESGGIEYTADVLWGLQLQVLNEKVFENNGDITGKRAKVKEAKNENPRKIELVCLKNRYGVSNYSAYFEYYADQDLFKQGKAEEPKRTY